MTNFYKIFSFVLAVVLFASPATTLAQYGGGTSVNIGSPTSGTTTADNNSTSGPKFSANNTGDSININIETAKKGSVLDVKIGNSNSGVFKIKFTVDADVTNAKIAVSKIDSSQLFTGFPGGFVTAYALTLTNINYDQITNFSFAFKVKKNLVAGKNLLAYSSNSPWALAKLSTEADSSVASDEMAYLGSASIAFKQFGVSAATANQVNTVTNASGNGIAVLNNTNSVELVRTGSTENFEIFSTLTILAVMLGFSFVLVKTNQIPGRN